VRCRQPRCLACPQAPIEIRAGDQDDRRPLALHVVRDTRARPPRSGGLRRSVPDSYEKRDRRDQQAIDEHENDPNDSNDPNASKV
jgi:hypothetical protein